MLRKIQPEESHPEQLTKPLSGGKKYGISLDLSLIQRYRIHYFQTTRIIDLVIDETFKVIAALGGKTPWPDSNTYKKTFYDTLIPATYNHRPSMLQDLENNKPTEVDALVGFVSSQGKQVALATPTCDLLVAMVKFKESQNIT
ncbi:MAG: hypothetical protein GY702_09430 [Desulfobulbaceae bacterium]|nr:hypothetical protein [Desulfobulbaceae bacterium]